MCFLNKITTLALCLLWGSLSAVSVRGQIHESITEETNVFLSKDKSIELRQFPPFLIDEHLYGIYQIPMRDMNGVFIHIYPNGKVVVSEYADISKLRPICEGTYYVDGSKINIESHCDSDNDLSPIKKSDENIALHWFGKSSNGFIESSVLVAEDDLNRLKYTAGNGVSYFERVKEYYNWQKELLRFENSKSP